MRRSVAAPAPAPSEARALPLPFAEPEAPVRPAATSTPMPVIARAVARPEPRTEPPVPLALASVPGPSIARSFAPSAPGTTLDYPPLTPAQMPLASHPATATNGNAAVQRAEAPVEAIGRLVGEGSGSHERVLATGFDWESPELPREIDKLAERLWQDLRRRLRVERERERGWV